MKVEIPQVPKGTTEDAVVVNLESYELCSAFNDWRLGNRDVWSYQCGSSGLGRTFAVFPAQFKDRIEAWMTSQGVGS